MSTLHKHSISTELVDTNETVSNLISVVVPVYNAEKYLHLCIESIITQTYKEIEIILINDGSTDKSGEICEKCAVNDKRIRVIHTENQGPAAARNIGIENSIGDFIFFIDSDDTIENEAFHLLLENYNQYKADITIGNFNKLRDASPASGHETVFPASKLLRKQDFIDYIRHYLKKPNRYPLFVYSWGRLFKASIIKDKNILFNTALRTFEDVAFNFEYLNYTNAIYFLKDSIYNHVVHDNYSSASMTISDKPEILFGYKQALVNVINFLNNSNSNADIQKEVGHAYICYTIIQLIRTCGQINNSNKTKVYKLIHGIINDSIVRGYLQYYAPSNSDSRILPILMKLKLVWPIMLVCQYKSRKRYKK